MSHRHCATFCVTFLIFLLLNTLPAKCDLHTHGPEEFGIGTLTVFDRVLFSRDDPMPKNYTFYYKYRAPSMNGLFGYVALNSTAPSSGMISSTYDMDFDKDGIVESNADIYNASSQFNVSMKIESFSSGVSWDTFMLFRRRHRFIKPRSFAMLCEVKAQRLRQTNRKLEFGSRINNDFLVRFERHHVHEKFSEFPSHKFHFFDGGVNINYVKLIYDSPTAVVFSNRIKMEKHEFATTIYGTNSTPFVTEIHIYGTRV